VKGIIVARELTNIFNFHPFDDGKINPTLRNKQEKHKNISRLFFTAAKGDVKELRRLHRQGEDLFASDYDARTSLHLACSEGHHRVVEYLVSLTDHMPLKERSIKLSPLDRWARTPLDYAITSDHPECAKYLQKVNPYKGCHCASKSGCFRVLNIKKSSICKKRITEFRSPSNPECLSLKAKRLWSPTKGALTKQSISKSMNPPPVRCSSLENVEFSMYEARTVNTRGITKSQIREKFSNF